METMSVIEINVKTSDVFCTFSLTFLILLCAKFKKMFGLFFVALKHSNVKGEMSVLNVVFYLTIVHNFSLLINIYIYINIFYFIFLT